MRMLQTCCLSIFVLGPLSLDPAPAAAAQGGCAALIEAAKKGLRGNARAVRECQMAQRSAQDVPNARKRLRESRLNLLRRRNAGPAITTGVMLSHRNRIDQAFERERRRAETRRVIGEMLGVMGGAALRGRGGGHH